jgi:hypothetical protein
MISRNIVDCVPELQTIYLSFTIAMAEANLPFMLTRTRCTAQDQAELFAMGRTKPGAKCWCGGHQNKIGTCKKHPFGLPVTWTLESKHIIGKAFDIALLKNGKPHWDVKISINPNDIPDYLEAARIGRSIGLIAGGLWVRKQDYPHFELREV